MRRFAAAGVIGFILMTAGISCASTVGAVMPGQAYSTTVSAIRSLPEGFTARIYGHLVERFDERHYMFKDTTGDLRVVIDRSKWGNIDVMPMDAIELQGFVRKDGIFSIMEVERVRKIPVRSVRTVDPSRYPTVVELIRMQDGAKVALRGTMEGKIGENLYLFRDGTGNVSAVVGPEA